MKFIKYSHIENSYRDKFINLIYLNGFDKGEWCVGEKADGSNFSVWLDCQADYIRFSKRSGFIDSSSNFYGYQNIAGHLCTKIRELRDRFYPAAQEIGIYGELYGGIYKHPDVPINMTAVRIQNRISYRPDTGFRAFDLRIDGHLVNYKEACSQFEAIGLEYAKILFCGSFADCLRYPNEFQTTIPAELGLPPIENNICEGVVLKPCAPCYIGGVRVILKNKNNKFKEKGGEPKNRKEYKSIELGEEGKSLLEELDSYICQSRLDNVLSKEEQDCIKFKNFGPLLGKFLIDIWDDFHADNDFALAKLDQKEQKLIKKIASTIASNLLREHLKKVEL